MKEMPKLVGTNHKLASGITSITKLLKQKLVGKRLTITGITLTKPMLMQVLVGISQMPVSGITSINQMPGLKRVGRRLTITGTTSMIPTLML